MRSGEPSRCRRCCPATTTVLLWPGTYSHEDSMREALATIGKRGWTLKFTGPGTLKDDLKCADVIWYLSDWNPPPDFAKTHVPEIEAFVHGGGGLLVGGLGWSFRQERAGESYAADELGKVFGFRFTNDAFRSKEDQLITLEVER